MEKPRNRLQRLAILVMLAALPAWAGSPLVVPTVRSVNVETRRVQIDLHPEAGPGATLIVGRGRDPVALGRFSDASEAAATFEFSDLRALSGCATPNAWLMPATTIAALFDEWPADVELWAPLDSLGPGRQTAWISAGRNQGAQIGDVWWFRIAGQPAARFTVRLASADMCFAAVTPLVADLRLRSGEHVALWPPPAQRRDGMAATAVAFVDARGQAPIAWLAAPEGVECPAEAHVDYFRIRRYIGHGRVERRDSRFWYASFTAAASPPTTQPTTSAPGFGPAESRPATLPARAPTAELCVADEARIRTQAQIERRTFVARVFELTAAGVLINAGETDGVYVGQLGTAYRGDNALSGIEVRRTQPTYAAIESVRKLDEPPVHLSLGDEVRFGPVPSEPEVIGSIETVVDDVLFTARLERADASTAHVLGVRSGGHGVAAALLVAVDGANAWGIALPKSYTAPLRAGMLLTRDNP